MGRPKKKQLAGIELSGTIAKPIDDTSLILPFIRDLDSPEFKTALNERADRLHQLRIAKLPELARQLGMAVERYDFSTHSGLMVFYAQIALNMAVKFQIPGFLEVKAKWSREIVKLAMDGGDARKRLGLSNPDLEACLIVVQGLDSELTRPGRKTAAIKRAKTLRNLVSILRRRLAREESARQANEQRRKTAPAASTSLH
ncbi:MAG TPA: hypothetical protein VH206_17430 [Xanthobacteraceae bacterium]|jgi:hypothetical protein|nr:hypothetical protein [Xanthobacteraceae bacterium]